MTIPLPERRTREFHGVDPEVFEREIRPVGRPAIMRGLVDNWPAVQAGKAGGKALADYLSTFTGSQPAPVLSIPQDQAGLFFYDETLTGTNFETLPMPLTALFQRLLDMEGMDRPPSMAAQSLAEPAAAPGFSAANPAPLPVHGTVARLWIGNAAIVQTHHDMNENIACAVAGRRRFTFFPPSQTGNLYLGPFERTLAGPLTSMVRLDAPDHTRFPNFHKAWAEAETADLEPGDALYIPYMWWHHVQSFDSFAMLVNYWWNVAPPQHRPMEALIHAMLGVRDLPAEQREAWRSMFDAFVFDAGDTPGGHLAPSARGMQGPLSPARADHLKRALAANMTRRP